MEVSTIFYTLGILALVKGLFVIIFEKKTIKWVSKIIKVPLRFRKMAILEIITAVILLLIAHYSNFN